MRMQGEKGTVIGEKSMKNEKYKKLSIKEFTKAAGRYESNHAGIDVYKRQDSIFNITAPSFLSADPGFQAAP